MCNTQVGFHLLNEILLGVSILVRGFLVQFMIFKRFERPIIELQGKIPPKNLYSLNLTDNRIHFWI